MALSITGLINNITNSVQNLVGALTGTKSSNGLYPEDDNTRAALSTINKENWNHLPAPYSFAVFNGNINEFRGTPFGEFQLPLAPGKINQTEHMAISIKNTQGGTVVSHSGNKYKTLQISGTTGLAPFRGAGGVQASNGEAIFQPNELKYKSGFEVFQQLRNYFRAYYEFKKNLRDPSVQALRLVFKNYKDGEFLIIELLDFQMDRQAPRSFLYDYNISFKVLGSLSFKSKDDNLLEFEKKLQQAVQVIDFARGVFLRSQDILRQIEATYDATILEPLRKASMAIKAFQGIPSTAADMGNRIINKTMTETAALGLLIKISDLKAAAATGTGGSTLLENTALPNDLKAATKLNPAGAITDLNESIFLLDPEDFPQTAQDAFSLDLQASLELPRSFYESALEDLYRVKNNAEDFFGMGDSEYDAIFDRVATLEADVAKVITDEEFDLLDGFNQAIRGLQNILASDTLFKSSFDDRIQTIINSFDGQIVLQSLPAVQQIQMPKDTDLERLAQIYLNDSTRWVEIAELNDLRAPYVIQDISDTTSNVIHPNQTILIPASPRSGFSKLPNGKEITSGPDLTELEKSLGTDLKLTDKFDISLGNNGDLQIIRGAENVAQAVILKLGYEKGELMRAPDIGVGLGIGRKFPALSDVKESLVRSLTQDPRIDKVEKIALRQVNSSLELSFEIKIKQVDIPVPVVIKV